MNVRSSGSCLFLRNGCLFYQHELFIFHFSMFVHRKNRYNNSRLLILRCWRTRKMKLSILDQVPITSGKDAYDALQAAIRLSQIGEKLGYKRYWFAEHHDLFGLACPNPDVMIGAIGQQTEKIRLGAGAVLLPYYRPYRVAETYNLLATLYPNRIDLGLGRAPGGSAEVSLALSENYLKGVKEFPKKISELLTFLYGSFPEEHTYHRLRATPVPN